MYCLLLSGLFGEGQLCVCFFYIRTFLKLLYSDLILQAASISSDTAVAEMVEYSKSPFYNLLAHIFWL